MSTISYLSQSSSSLQLAGASVDLASAAKALVTPKNKNVPDGINGFLFSIPMTDQLSFQSDITDYYTQSNTAIQDHIALKPIRITLTGAVSELLYTKSAVSAFAEQSINRLYNTSALTPKLAQTATDYLAKYDELLRQIDQTVKTANDLATLFGYQSAPKTAQQKAYKILSDFWVSRTLCTVNTPWDVFDNMAIENLEFSQDETTKDVSEVTVTFKQLKSVQITASKVPLPPKARAQRSTPTNQGNVKGASIGYRIWQGF